MSRKFEFGNGAVSALVVFVIAVCLLPAATAAENVTQDLTLDTEVERVVLDANEVYARFNISWYMGAHFGDTIEISIDLAEVDFGFETGGFNFFFEYDSTLMTLLDVQPGQLLQDCAWEAFSWRVGEPDDCGGAPCPNATFQVFGLADNIYPAGQPLCWADTPGQIAVATFEVTSDSAYDCQDAPISWLWYDCVDNEVSSRYGDSVYMSNVVYDFDLYTPVPVETTFPNTSGALSECFPSSTIIPAIDFQHGRMDIWCYDNIDARGDVNLNEIPYEIADWVLFTNYLIYGDTVFTYNLADQTQATDVNNDGIFVTLDDLIYLLRVIVGDALPFPRLPVANDTLVITQNPHAGTVSFDYPDSIRAFYLIFEGEVEPTLSQPFEFYGWHYDSTVTKVLLQPGFDLATAEPGELFSYTGQGLLTEAYAAYNGWNEVPVRIEITSGNAVLEIEPDTVFMLQRRALEPIPGSIALSDLEGCAAEDIDPTSVLINGTVVPTSVIVGGGLAAINFDVRDLAESYGWVYDTHVMLYTVAFDAGPDCPADAVSWLTLVGHRSGDVTLDGEINVSDLTYLVQYAFAGGDAPEYVQAGDVDRSGETNVSDITALVQILFM